MAATTMVHVRVDENIKVQAAETLASMGLTVSDAVRVFLTRVVMERQLPFALTAPNDEPVHQSARVTKAAASGQEDRRPRSGQSRRGRRT